MVTVVPQQGSLGGATAVRPDRCIPHATTSTSLSRSCIARRRAIRRWRLRLCAARCRGPCRAATAAAAAAVLHNHKSGAVGDRPYEYVHRAAACADVHGVQNASPHRWQEGVQQRRPGLWLRQQILQLHWLLRDGRCRQVACIGRRRSGSSGSGGSSSSTGDSRMAARRSSSHAGTWMHRRCRCGDRCCSAELHRCRRRCWRLIGHRSVTGCSCDCWCARAAGPGQVRVLLCGHQETTSNPCRSVCHFVTCALPMHVAPHDKAQLVHEGGRGSHGQWCLGRTRAPAGRWAAGRRAVGISLSQGAAAAQHAEPLRSALGARHTSCRGTTQMQSEVQGWQTHSHSHRRHEVRLRLTPRAAFCTCARNSLAACSTAQPSLCGMHAAGSFTWDVAARGWLAGKAPAALPLRVLDPDSTSSHTRLRGTPQQYT